MLNEFNWLTEDHDPSLMGEGKPFALNGAINSKIYMYYGEGWKLPVDVLVLGQNESLSERIDGNATVFDIAGPVFDEQCARIEKVFTGSAEIVEAGNLGQSHVIFAIGPKYDKNYIDASVSALHTSVRTALSLAVQNKLKSVALHCVYLQNKKFPRWDAAHVVLRTVRRFLEQPTGGGGDRLEKVVFCLLDKDDLEIYNTLLPAYFPRTEEEEAEQVGHLPDGGVGKAIGNEWGTIIFEDRQLRVAAGPGSSARDYMKKPTPTASGASTAAEGNNNNGTVMKETKPVTLVPPINPNSIFASATRRFTGEGKLSDMWPKPVGMTTVAPNTKAKRNPFARPVTTGSDEQDEMVRLKTQFEGWLGELKAYQADAASASGGSNNGTQSNSAAAFSEVADPLAAFDTTRTPNMQLKADLADMEAMHFLNIGGKDLKGRPVVCLTAANITSLAMDMRKVCIYAMQVMEPLRCVPYVLVYCSAGITDDSSPALHWVNSIFVLLSIRYKENLQQLYLLHASMWMRMYIWGGIPVTGARTFWKDYEVISNLMELDQYVIVRPLKLPRSVIEYDKYHYPSEHARVYGVSR